MKSIIRTDSGEKKSLLKKKAKQKVTNSDNGNQREIRTDRIRLK
jgi:hypothetical protein